MLNNKTSGISLTRFLSLLLLSAGLGACAQAPEQPIMVEPEPLVEKQEAPPPPPAPKVVVQREYPDRYVVKRGDTLWDIAKRFLKDPWLWPEVWQINPEIRNPHLIYPGDVLVLYYDENGKPYITLEGVPGFAPPSRVKTVKLSPQVRYETLDKAITTIPRAAIAPFLGGPRIVTEVELEYAPYVISSFEEHLVSGTGNLIYAKNIRDWDIGEYDVIRPKGEYRDPDTGELLGYEVVRLADARLLREGDPASLSITKARQEVINGDMLLPKEDGGFDYNFIPRPPLEDVRGQIISVFNGVSQIGQYNIVVLNVGEREGLEPGHVLAIFQQGAKVRDPRAFWSWSRVSMPDERAGILMVFRVYPKVSYALVMEAQRSLHVNDKVGNP